jgi:hypothetical protein
VVFGAEDPGEYNVMCGADGRVEKMVVFGADGSGKDLCD